MIHENTLIIGGSHGISFELVRRLLARGDAVYCACRTQGDLAEYNLLGHERLHHIPFDCLADDLPIDLLPQTLHGFAYFPGSINLGPLRSIKLEVLRDDFELNVVSAVKVFRDCVSRLKSADQASAVFLSTVAVGHGVAMHSSVAAAKGAIEALSKTWAAELAPKIRVNCVAPALTDTPLAGKLLSNPARREAMNGLYPLGRIGRPNDVAAVIDFLLNRENSWITGQVIGVDGGLSGVLRV